MCSAGAYQRTGLSATADGLDVTPLVSFAVDDASVAEMSGDLLVGLSPGSVVVYLAGRDAVIAVELTSRVVTGAAWEEVPPSSWDSVTAFSAAVRLSNTMTAEGHGGAAAPEAAESSNAKSSGQNTPPDMAVDQERGQKGKRDPKVDTEEDKPPAKNKKSTSN